MDRRESTYCDHRHRRVLEYRQAGHHHWTAREIPTHAVRPADNTRGDPPILKEIFINLILVRRPLKFWVSAANISDEFITGLDAVHANDSWI
jgi:hypothetical protein